MSDKEIGYVARALVRVFESPNVLDSNLEAANLVDVIDRLSAAVGQLAKSVSDLAHAFTVISGQPQSGASALPYKALYRVEEACEVTGLGRTKVYDEIKSGRLRVVRVGKSVRIPAEELRAYVDRAKADAGLMPGRR